MRKPGVSGLAAVLSQNPGEPQNGRYGENFCGAEVIARLRRVLIEPVIVFKPMCMFIFTRYTA